MGSDWCKGIGPLIPENKLFCKAGRRTGAFHQPNHTLEKIPVVHGQFQNQLNCVQLGDTSCRQLFVTPPLVEHQDVELLEAAPDSEMAAGGALSVPGCAEPQGVRCRASAGAVSDQMLHVLLGGQVCSDEGQQLMFLF